MKNITNMVKILGFVATAIGFGAELLHDWVDEKEMDAKIEEKVNEALAKREENEDEEESWQGLFLFILRGGGMNDIAIDTIMRFRNERLISPNEDMPRESYFKASYSIWAGYELLERVMDHPLTSADDIINEFALKMELFARETDDEEAKLKFRVASNVAAEILLPYV